MDSSRLAAALATAAESRFTGQVILRRPNGESYIVSVENGVALQVDVSVDENAGPVSRTDRVREAVMSELSAPASADDATRARFAARRISRIANVPGEVVVVAEEEIVFSDEDGLTTPPAPVVAAPPPSSPGPKSARSGSARPRVAIPREEDGPNSDRAPTSVRASGAVPPLALALAKAKEARYTGGIVLRRPSGEAYTVAVYDGEPVGVEPGPDDAGTSALGQVRDAVLADSAPPGASAEALVRQATRRLGRILTLAGETSLDPTLSVAPPPVVSKRASSKPPRSRPGASSPLSEPPPSVRALAPRTMPPRIAEAEGGPRRSISVTDLLATRPPTPVPAAAPTTAPASKPRLDTPDPAPAPPARSPSFSEITARIPTPVPASGRASPLPPASRPRISIPAPAPAPAPAGPARRVSVTEAPPPHILTPVPPSNVTIPPPPPSRPGATRPTSPGFRRVSLPPSERQIPVAAPLLDPRDADPRLLRQAIRTRVGLGEFAEAERLIREFPGEAKDPEMQALTAWLRSNLGGDTDGPLQVLSSLLRMNPKCEYALYYRGLLLKRTGELKAALREFVTLAKQDPKHSGALREIQELRSNPRWE